MKNFISIKDCDNVKSLVAKVLAIKKDPFLQKNIGTNKTLGLVFLNPSLRTRLSTQKAAMNLGMQTIVMNAGTEAWTWELNDGAIMNENTVEHIKDAVHVLEQYCDIIAVRSFAQLTDANEDYNETIVNAFIKHSSKPIISLESATLHPLQSLTDLVTIKENWNQKRKPKVLLTWAPHIKPLPQAVANSFTQWMHAADVEFTIAHPEGYELSKNFIGNAKVIHDQDVALKNVDFVYAKNWSAYTDYGKMPVVETDWMLTNEKMTLTNNAKFMHCMPVRRNVEVSDEVLNSMNSFIYRQANNRTFAAQAVLHEILKTN